VKRGYPDWSRGVWIALEGIAHPATRDSLALVGRDKDFMVLKTVSATSVDIVYLYQVPKGKTLFITDFHAYCNGRPFYANLCWYKAPDVYYFGFISRDAGSWSGAVNMTKPTRVPEEAYLRVDLWNGDSSSHDFYIYVAAIEADIV